MSLFNITFLVLISVLSICGCKVDVQQPMRVMRRKEETSVSIPCSVNISSCLGHGLDKLQISWYVFHKVSYYKIDWTNQTNKYTLEDQNLKISSLSTKDCGVYYCAAALGIAAHKAQAIGQGITLKVTERGLNTRQSLLLTLLVLLIAYSLLVLCFIICIKTGRFKSVSKGRWSTSQQDCSRQVVFSGVVQELYKRNLVGDKILAHRSVSQEKAKEHQTQDKYEDIYQNLDE